MAVKHIEIDEIGKDEAIRSIGPETIDDDNPSALDEVGVEGAMPPPAKRSPISTTPSTRMAGLGDGVEHRRRWDHAEIVAAIGALKPSGLAGKASKDAAGSGYWSA